MRRLSAHWQRIQTSRLFHSAHGRSARLLELLPISNSIGAYGKPVAPHVLAAARVSDCGSRQERSTGTVPRYNLPNATAAQVRRTAVRWALMGER